jgi:hypothetical protein
MKTRSCLPFLLAFPWLAAAQLGPVIGPRGVVNAFTQEPAPSAVAPGGLIWIHGLNFGSLDDTKVFINGAAARVLSVGLTRIVAQVPPETAPGLAEVVVRVGESRSRAARMLVQLVAPSVRTAGDAGYGEAAAAISGGTATLAASGFPRDTAVTAHVGGLAAAAEVAARDDRPGELDLKITLPTGWQPGDVISLRSAGRTANRTTIRSLSRPVVSFIRLPAEAPELKALVSSDLRGNYLIATAAPDAQGCYPSFLFDAAKPAAARLDACLISANQNDLTPVVAEAEGSALAALQGPAQGQAPAGVSSKVVLYHPERADPMTVQLPAAATNLLGAGAEGVTAILAGDPIRRVTIDTRTGEVREAAGAGTALPAGGGVSVPIDVGEGQILSTPATAADGSVGVVVGEQAEQPTWMKFVIVSPQGGATSVPFPENWLALMAPAPSVPSGDAAGRAGIGAAARATAVFDAGSNAFWVLARNSSNSAHGLIAFTSADAIPRLIRFPEGWFAAACTTRVPVYSFQLSSILAVPVTPTLETESKNPCLGRGFVVVDPAMDTPSVISLPAQAPLNLTAAAATSMNDFVYGGNGTSPDSLVVFDGAMRAAAQLSLPPGISSFSGLVPIASMNALTATAARSSPGDAGFVFFDLEKSEVRALGLPDGFSSASPVAVFPVTRKLVATGARSDGGGSQFIVYDLVTGDLVLIPNPEGVAWVGSVVQQAATGVPTGGLPGGGLPPGGGFPPGGGIPRGGGLPGGVTPGAAPAGAGLVQANAKANTVAAVCYDADRKQIGVVGIRIP